VPYANLCPSFGTKLYTFDTNSIATLVDHHLSDFLSYLTICFTGQFILSHIEIGTLPFITMKRPPEGSLLKEG
jgi:hypothetical protein